MRAYLIDATKQEVRAVDYNTSADLHELVGGWIEIAWKWTGGDVLYVDEEGMFKPQVGGFHLSERPDQPLVGNGMVVGREVEDDSGDGFHTEPPQIPIDVVRKRVRFLNRAQLDAWGKANASEPSATFTMVNKDGTVTHEVIGRFGSLFADMPRPEGEKECESEGLKPPVAHQHSQEESTE